MRWYIKPPFDGMYVYVCILRARVQPTLDPYAEAFLWQAHCVNPGGEESVCLMMCVNVCVTEG